MQNKYQQSLLEVYLHFKMAVNALKQVYGCKIEDETGAFLIWLPGLVPSPFEKYELCTLVYS